jgi:hypothetical protein
MIKLNKELFDQSYTKKGDLFVLDFKMKQLISVRNLSDFVKLEKIRELILCQNNLKTIEVAFTMMYPLIFANSFKDLAQGVGPLNQLH